VERLEQHAASLAAAQTVASTAKVGRPLAPRLYDNTKVLTNAYHAIVEAVSAHQSITPAAEWLLDNFHVIDEQIREIKDSLPPGYYRQLPKLANGPLEGYPRVFGVAWAIVAHTDSVFDLQRLTRFVEAYQQVQPLTIGELWAIAITLRITLVENLRRLAEAMVVRLRAGQLADALADRILGTESQAPEPSSTILKSLDRTPWSPAFAVQFAQRLRDRDPNTTPALQWLNERLSAGGTNTDEIVRDEVQSQSVMNVTVRNVITSMRLVSMINWAEFFETVSPIDAIMRAGSDFAAMDFPTRDLYRRAIEKLSRESGRDETDIAVRAILAAKKAAGAMLDENCDARRQTDPGYYLIAEGRRDFEKQLCCRISMRTRLHRLSSDIGVLSYVGVIAFVTAVILSLALLSVSYAETDTWILIALGIVGLIPASDVAIAVVNRAVTQQIGATILPGLELRDGIPSDLRTIVVVPTLLTSISAIEKQIERLEVHHLSNPDENIVFALLSDWCDASNKQTADDEHLLSAAVAAIAHLNEHYGSVQNHARFFLLHRERVWNEGEREWMGWERKRGKLHELNRLLRGATDTTFLAVGDHALSLPSDIRYVITLDADTRLPIGTARRLVGKIAHPLNRPYLNRQTRIITQGHAILQPRVTPSLPIGSEGSLYQRVFSGPNGLDPYALAVSDVYQDLFEEGSYCGKGIYEVDVLEAALEGQIPENAVLSHDLLEGIYARAGLASDIEVVEEFPSRYDVSAARQHRWVRGDWQLLPWIFGIAKTAHEDARKTEIPSIGRWKLLDNLRRSLSAPAALLAMLTAWLLPLPAAEIWTAYILATIALPPFVPAIVGIVPRRVGVSLSNHVRSMRDDFELGLLQSAFLVTFLAHQAWIVVDAVVRTLLRVFIFRRHLLEWVTAAQTNDNMRFDRRTLIVQIGSSVAFAVFAGTLILLADQGTWPIAAPFSALWMLSPIIARWASERPLSEGRLSVSPEDALTLRLIARRTWRYFEKFVTADDNMLPPDNFQETPKPVVARRTSPTNIGLYLLSVVAARDFGWLGTADTLERLEATFATMEKLEQFRGHFYNWYDTGDLRALEPRYISSVDSGNLAGHLIVLGNACREMVEGPITHPNWIAGLQDNLALIREAMSLHAENGRLTIGTPSDLVSAVDTFAKSLECAPTNPVGIARHLDELVAQTARLVELARSRSSVRSDEEIIEWADALHACVSAHKRDFDMLMPWARLIGGLAMSDDEVTSLLDTMPTLASLPAHCDAALQLLAIREERGESREPATLLISALKTSASAARSVVQRLMAFAELTKTMFDNMKFDFLFDDSRQLISIGYRHSNGILDSNFYDLLASEARLASFVAIAKGDIPAKHWFRLGRTLTPIETGSGLISWSGSMFEYLMPSLVMRAPAGSLLEQTNCLVVRRQEEYGDKLGVPWGMSESAYNARDIEQTYQYSSFGVPDLGYKRGLGESIVIAPYASGLGSMVDPGSAASNYKRIAGIGGRGAYGWYEALDYTRARLPEGAKFAIVRAYMAHHQGMTIVAIANALQNGRMRTRFHAEPIMQATELLLQERMPRDVAVARPLPNHAPSPTEFVNLDPDIQRRYMSAHSRVPRTQILSNGRYSTMVTATGSGYSRWNDVAITRWREDVTCDKWGAYIFLRDVNSGEVWSAGYQPTVVEPDSYEVIFSEDRAEIVRSDGAITTALEIAVSAEDDAEVRRVSVTNHGSRTREIEITSYAEIALALQPNDVSHPAFAKLFVQTEFLPHLSAIVATRRQRSAADPVVWAAHLAVVEGESSGDAQFETDRARFLGRGQTIRSSAAIEDGWPLSNTAGAVLDPIFSLRRRVRIPRGATVRVAFWTLAAASREDVLDLADKHNDSMAFERATTLAWTQAQMQLHHLRIGSNEAHLFQRLANHVLYSDATLRPASDVIKRDARKVSMLWAHGISGDLPIVLVRVEDQGDLDLVSQLLRAHEYWRLKQLAVDLVILNERPASYVQDLQNALEALVRTNQAIPRIARKDARGAIFILRADLISPEIRGLLQATARAVLRGDRGTLAEQINRARNRMPGSPRPALPPAPAAVSEIAAARPELEFFNGLGGFANDGSEYQTILQGNARTPAPWINVIANPSFGFQVSTEGSGFTWSVNSQQNQLTPWSNDSVSDAPGEVIYVRDEDTGEMWGPTALPIRVKTASYTAQHGQGYSRFEHESHGISLELVQYVPTADPIKISRLKIINRSGRERRLSITAYVEWVLGANRSATAPFVITEIDSETGAIFAQNPWNDQFGERVAFADLNDRQTAWTGDRTEFIGRDGALDCPL
jgi:cyclic beta-1,2-glucan synthetase